MSKDTLENYADLYLRAGGIGNELLPLNESQIRSTEVQPIVVQIPLVDVFERLKKVKADNWQRDFCNRLQAATENQHVKGVRALIHAQPQLGKSVILAQTYPAWVLGHAPLHREAVATYNVSRSQRHARVVIRMMQSAEYKDLFRHKDCHLPNIASIEGFSTNARLELNDGQVSYNPMGLQSGFVGSGADNLIIDDPYKEAKEASSQTIRLNIEAFWDETANTRITEFANVFGMFHRYHQADLAGYLLATGEFDYWRYAAEADGDYTDDETGLVYPDPLGRPIGEYISNRFTNDYYERQKKNPKTWFSQFQGKPTGEEGNTFNVNKIQILDQITDYEKILQMESECLHWARAWDNAATDGDSGAFTAGVKMGITADERILIFDARRERVNTADRYELQLETAKDDGMLVPILIPQDPGSAGKDTAFQTKQMLESERFTCFTEVVTGSKELRAQPFSVAVNSGKVFAVGGEYLKEFLKEYKNFPLSTFKDQVDAGSDCYRHLYKLVRTGTVIKNYKQSRQIVSWDKFATRFGHKIPAYWRLYIGARIERDGSKPSGAAIIARASQNANLGEALFLVGCCKQMSGDFNRIFDWIKDTLNLRVEQSQNIPPIYLNDGSEEILTVIRKKLNLQVRVFNNGNISGIDEMNWHLAAKVNQPHSFNADEYASGFYWLTDKEEVEQPLDDRKGLLSARQEVLAWKLNDKGEPQPFGGIVLDAVRMVMSNFKTFSTPLTKQEEFEEFLKKNHPHLTEEAIKAEPEHRRSSRYVMLNLEREKFFNKNNRDYESNNAFAELYHQQGLKDDYSWMEDDFSWLNNL